MSRNGIVLATRGTRLRNWTRRIESLVVASMLLSVVHAYSASADNAAPSNPPAEAVQKLPRPAEPPTIPPIEKLVLHDDSSLVGGCEVCVYLIENRADQKDVCRGLKNPVYQKNCVEVAESLYWWLANEVYWPDVGCNRRSGGIIKREHPCPAHAVCQWILQPHTRTPYCPPDPMYSKPPAPRD